MFLAVFNEFKRTDTNFVFDKINKFKRFTMSYIVPCTDAGARYRQKWHNLGIFKAFSCSKDFTELYN